MKKILLSVLLMNAIFGISEAVLPPFYSSVAEYKALINDKHLEEILGSGQAIQGIKRVNDGFIVWTPKYVLRVDVVYEATGKIGPGKFNLVFHELKEKTDD